MKIQPSTNMFRKHLPKDQTQQRIANLQSHKGFLISHLFQALAGLPLAQGWESLLQIPRPDFSVGVVFHTQGHGAAPSATYRVQNQAKGMLPVNLWGRSPGVLTAELLFLLSLMKMERKKKIAHWLLS